MKTRRGFSEKVFRMEPSSWLRRLENKWKRVKMASCLKDWEKSARIGTKRDSCELKVKTLPQQAAQEKQVFIFDSYYDAQNIDLCRIFYLILSNFTHHVSSSPILFNSQIFSQIFSIFSKFIQFSNFLQYFFQFVIIFPIF